MHVKLCTARDMLEQPPQPQQVMGHCVAFIPVISALHVPTCKLDAVVAGRSRTQIMPLWQPYEFVGTE